MFKYWVRLTKALLSWRQTRIKQESKEAKTIQEAVWTLHKFMASTEDGYPESSEVIGKIPIDLNIFWIMF